MYIWLMAHVGSSLDNPMMKGSCFRDILYKYNERRGLFSERFKLLSLCSNWIIFLLSEVIHPLYN